VHHGVCQFTVRGHQQQAAGIDVQPANRYPAGATQTWQFVEYRGSALWIRTGGYFPGGFVIDQVTVLAVSRDGLPLLPFKAHTVIARDGLPNDGNGAIDAYVTVLDTGLQHSPGAKSGGCHDLLQAFGFMSGFVVGSATSAHWSWLSWSASSGAGASSE